MPRAAYYEQLRLIDVGKHLVAKNGRVCWTNISHPTFLSKVEDVLQGRRVRLKGWWQDGASIRSSRVANPPSIWSDRAHRHPPAGAPAEEVRAHLVSMRGNDPSLFGRIVLITWKGVARDAGLLRP
jgi:hypothetical protein